ncbi:MAG: transketolase, partial [Propionibacteriales bacterium]|nr:transketolase [Propionibacteriales bacterium]
FGIREHAMGNILNAINTGLTRAYGGTFLVFADYMRGAVRLAALQKIPTIFVWTHDSIGVGEDGPTHQPIEHVESLRIMPGIDVIRPADANETAQAWALALSHTDRPSALILSRQDLPIFDREADGMAPATEVAKGAYTLIEADGELKVVIIATGSEVSVAVEARAALQAEGIGTRVVSAPCLEWFDAQPADYRASVLPDGVAKVAVEAGVPTGWRGYVGQAGEIVGIDHFGESASGNVLFAKYGFTADNVAAKAKLALSRLG